MWEVVRMPTGAHVLHMKRVYKTKKDAEGDIERRKAWLVTCGNEQEFGVCDNITFAAVIDIGEFQQGTAIYVKTDKEMVLFIYIRLPQGMTVSDEIVLELKKALYGLKQVGRLWSKLLQQKLVNVGFEQNLTDIWVYYSPWQGVLIVVGVYVDAVLVTGTEQNALDLPVKDLGVASKFLGMRDLDQKVAIVNMLQRFGMDEARGVRTPICVERGRCGGSGGVPVAGWEFDMDCPLRGSRHRFCFEQGLSPDAQPLIAYTGAGFAADKRDRKSVTGGLVTLDGIPSVTFHDGGLVYDGVSYGNGVTWGERTARRAWRDHEEPMPLRVDNQAVLRQLEGETASAKAINFMSTINSWDDTHEREC
ncbi:Hypothetical protein PHPALM_19845 [Phytophthora palmivora]|uniref:Reverse transcriptase Ty1/copia-type domain-containing protein n=1 Tax=Phytophthora palmivora TaxID=4796 RepID=A0A2P4XGB6_9STRA|nr:Hypothetical protein PHPALM_19845 [Phytophthora palmivora]